MIKFKWIYITMGALLLSLLGCEKLIFDPTNEETPGVEPKVHLSVNVRAAQPKSGLRSSSINTEDTDFEDHVHSLAMVIFDSEEGDIVGEPYLNDNLGSGVATYAFTVEMKPGNYDFYFIANVPSAATYLTGKSRDEIDTYLKDLNILNATLYQGATSQLGFPMARVYRNQKIVGGGTVYQPLPFEPKINSGDEYTVVTNYNESGITRSYVELIRVVAKLEINLDASSASIVKNIKYHNAFGQYSLAPQSSPITSPTYVADAVLTPVDNNTNTYIYYMPEALISSSWTVTGENKPINYFSITTKGGDVYNVPIITSESEIAFSANYLTKATGQETGFRPDYNIFRNHHYKYTIRIQQDIEILYTINPWNQVKRQLFMGYGYNVEVDEDGNISITNTLDDCMPHKVRLEAMNSAVFTGNPAPTPNNAVEFGYDSADTSIDPLKMKTGYSEQFKIDKEAVGDGAEYMKILYNGVSVYTFKK